jgi:hypothetical protein
VLALHPRCSVASYATIFTCRPMLLSSYFAPVLRLLSRSCLLSGLQILWARSSLLSTALCLPPTCLVRLPHACPPSPLSSSSPSYPLSLPLSQVTSRVDEGAGLPRDPLDLLGAAVVAFSGRGGNGRRGQEARWRAFRTGQGYAASARPPPSGLLLSPVHCPLSTVHFLLSGACCLLSAV